MIKYVKFREKSQVSHFFPIFFCSFGRGVSRVRKKWPIKTINLCLSKAFDLDMKIQVFLLALSAQGVR